MPFRRASLTLEERTMLAELWVHECKRLGMKTVVHVSHMCLRTARDLAIHAAKIGADSIGMYPPFAPESPPDLAAVARSIEFATHDIDLPLCNAPTSTNTAFWTDFMSRKVLLPHPSCHWCIPQRQRPHRILQSALAAATPGRCFAPSHLEIIVISLPKIPSPWSTTAPSASCSCLPHPPLQQASSSSARTWTTSPECSPTRASTLCGRPSQSCRSFPFAPFSVGLLHTDWHYCGAGCSLESQRLRAGRALLRRDCQDNV